MSEPTEAMKAMARRIAQANADSAQECLFGPAIDQTVRRVLEDALAQAALTAMIETQECDAALVDGRKSAHHTHADVEFNEEMDAIAAAIRSGDHYGKEPGQ